jgi:hypothetical protein
MLKIQRSHLFSSIKIHLFIIFRLATSAPVSPSDLTKKLLGSLTDPTNPITHSNIVERTEFYVPFATGHQVAEQPNGRRSYVAHREDKLHIQQENTQVTSGQSSNILKGVKVFISGYLASTTDTEVKRLVMQSGGRVVYVILTFNAKDYV